MENKKEPTGIIQSNHLVRAKIIRDEIQVHNIEFCNHKNKKNYRVVVKRLCKGQHINLETGEIIHDKISATRGESLASLYQSNLKLLELIKENTIDHKKILMLTLSYEEKQLDTKKIKYDMKYFLNRLRNRYTQFGTMEFIYALEFYEKMDGYHVHALLFFNQSPTAVFIPVAELRELWRHGDLSIGQPKRDNEVYFYLTPHVCKDITPKNKKMHNKALRQMALPAGQKLYHPSRGLKRPQILTDNYENIKKYLKENNYIFESEAVYLNPMTADNKKKIYHVKEYYKQEPSKPPRRPI